MKGMGSPLRTSTCGFTAISNPVLAYRLNPKWLKPVFNSSLILYTSIHTTLAPPLMMHNVLWFLSSENTNIKVCRLFQTLIVKPSVSNVQ
jgi:hypothetical protein